MKKIINTTIQDYLNENIDISYYYHGQCELFSLALHNTLDYDMYFFIDNSAEYEMDFGEYEYGFGLIHAYCKDKKGNYFDASGITSLDEVENDHAEYVNDPEHIHITKEDFYNYISEGLISGFKDIELKRLEDYIKENISNYKKNTNIDIKKFINESKNNDKRLITIIEKIREKYKKSLNKTDKELNSGYCEDIAYEISEKMNNDITIIDDGWFWSLEQISNIKTKSGEYWNIDNLKKFGLPPFEISDLSKIDLTGHVWIYYNGKHYDVECINGVSNFWDLPIFKRQISKEIFI